MKRFLNVQTLAFPAAAALAVLLAVVLRPHGPAELSEFARIAPAPWEGLDDEASAPELDMARERYLRGEWQATIPELTGAIPALGQSDAGCEARLYLGVCLLQLGRPAEAVEPLREAAASINRPLSERACWYRAQAHLLLGQVAEARPLLNELSRTSAAYGPSAAEQLLELRGR